MRKINLKKIKRVHFVGIGGIGTSAIARMMLQKRKKVTGSSDSRSLITDELEKLGIKVFSGHNAGNLSSTVNLVIYTTAVPKSNPELRKARKLKIRILTYPEALGLLSHDQYTVAIAGTHGKTTTTAMLAAMCLKAGLDPTVIVGSFLKDLKSNFIAGKKKLFITEACEYQRSFLNLNPKILAITNIDLDHLDYYKNLKDTQNAFRQFAKKVPKNGYLVCNPNNENMKPVLEGLRCKIVDYTAFQNKIILPMPGDHNIANAKVALTIGSLLKISPALSLRTLSRFSGTWRRSEFLGKTKKGALLYDDYAHHPTEIRATLEGFHTSFPKYKLIVVFQPHLYSRTKILFNDFSRSFTCANKVLVAPIYAAREKKDRKINSKMLAQRINKNGVSAISFADFNAIKKYLSRYVTRKSIIITMGAGDIYKLAGDLLYIRR